ncbi:unnamed protein product [Boreogadus saida]
MTLNSASVQAVTYSLLRLVPRHVRFHSRDEMASMIPDNQSEPMFHAKQMVAMTKAFLPQMKAQNHGHIVTIASALGLFSTACVEDYCASKFGAVGFTESLAHDLHAENLNGIKTTLVCPYIVDTGMFEGCEIRKELRGLIPPLDPLYTVKQSMNAILAEQRMICIPRLMYIPLLTRALLPWEANVATYRFMGGDRCMLPFIKNMEIKAAKDQVKTS